MKFLAVRLLIAPALVIGGIVLQQGACTSTSQIVTNSSEPVAVNDEIRTDILRAVFRNQKPRPGRSALLLAFDTDDSDDAESYSQYYDHFEKQSEKKPTNKTILFVRDGTHVRLGAELDFVASPQANGWLYLGQARYFEPKPRDRNEHLDRLEEEGSIRNFAFDYSRVWTTGDRQKIATVKNTLINRTKGKIDAEYNTLPRDEREYDRNISDYEKIGWVSGGYYIADGYWSLIHGGAAWFEANENSRLVNIANGRLSGRLSHWYSKKEIIDRYADDFNLNHRNSPDAKYNHMESIWQQWKESISGRDKDRIPTFTLARSKGRTSLIGRALVDGNTHRSFLLEVYFGPAPRKLARYDNPDFDFDKLSEAYPNLIDVFISPTQDTAFLLTDTEMIAIDIPSANELYRTLLKVKFNKVIMVEWATGRHVDQWQTELGSR